MASLRNALDDNSRNLLAAGFWNYLREDITFSLFERLPLKMDLESITLSITHDFDPDFLNSISLALGKIINKAFHHQLTLEEWDAAFETLQGWHQSCPRRLGPFHWQPIKSGTGHSLPSWRFLQASHGMLAVCFPLPELTIYSCQHALLSRCCSYSCATRTRRSRWSAQGGYAASS